MSLSRPVTFPFLKLPWLCIEGVVRSWDYFDIIFFALTSKKARRVVKSFRIPLSGIQIFVSDTTWIWLCRFSKIWIFSKPSLESSFDHNSSKYPLMLQKNAIPLYTSKADRSLKSYTNGNAITALKMAMEFLDEVFKCSVERVNINGDNFPESGDIGVKSIVNLCIDQTSSPPFGNAQSHKLNLLLKNLEVTGTCTFWLRRTENGFYCDPKLFKCQKLAFWSGSGAWVTREILLQFEVPRLTFDHCPFFVEDILLLITNWFHSDNKKFEYLYIGSRVKKTWIPSQMNLEQFGYFNLLHYIQSTQISLEGFATEELNPLPFSERTRVPPSESFGYIDFSKGLEIVRHDGLVATIHVNESAFLFYIWHDQSAITHN